MGMEIPACKNLGGVMEVTAANANIDSSGRTATIR
jgi:hypothetical protein